MTDELEDTRSTIEDYLLTYGWMLIVVAILGGGAYAQLSSTSDSNVTNMPADFDYGESKQVVERATGLSCSSTFNYSFEKKYAFECCQNVGNYTFCTNPEVKYNSSGPDKVRMQ